ncbi:MAG: hypothetical protein HeimC3_13920 [Candidatus Heimdallarchaeota archaeon LC_3]|nr:MAG: hypothetical protein HeimC3_13920 [Candidatus Heimdallarchaeota archaeon LC_3]
MIIIVTCPICNQLLELDHKSNLEQELATNEEYNPITSVPCNHLFKYSDGIFYQHSFIIKVDKKEKITPTPFFGEKICKTKPALYNTYLRPTVPIQDLYRRLQALNDELVYFKDKSMSLQSEITIAERISNKTDVVIDGDEMRQLLELESFKDNNQLLEHDYINMVLTSQHSMLELEDLKEKIKNVKYPSQELQIQFEILKKQYSELKEDFDMLEEKNHQLYQQLLEAQISSVVELSQGYHNKENENIDNSYNVFNDPSNELQIQMLQNECLIVNEQKNVYENEINRLSDLLVSNEKIIQELSNASASTSELKTKNFHLEETMKSFGKELENLINNIGEESIKKIILRYVTILSNRIADLEDLYLSFTSQIKYQVDQTRKMLNLPELPANHKALSLPKLEIKKLQTDIKKLIENIDRKIVPKTILKSEKSVKNPKPDPNEFYMRVTSNEWKYSKDDQLIFMKALFRLESFMMDTAKELTVDEQLKEFLKFFKNLKDTANDVITALNKLVTQKSEEFSKIPEFMQDYILKYVGKISELDLEKEVFTSEELTLLSYSLMISDIPLMEEGESEDKNNKKSQNDKKQKVSNSKKVKNTKKATKQTIKSPRIRKTTAPIPKTLEEKEIKTKLVSGKKTSNLAKMDIADLI